VPTNQRREKMVAKTIKLSFNGFWTEEDISDIPADSGIYLVYTCKYNELAEEGESGTVTLTGLIYIGEIKDADDRIDNHEKWDLWHKYAPKGEHICFAFAKVSSPDRERAECALIYYHKPVCCTQCKDSFDYDETTVISEIAYKEMVNLGSIESPITVK
jgi:hypothetical protein